MSAAERFVAILGLAFLRYLPPVALPALSPLRWAPVQLRIALALALAWLTALSQPVAALQGVANGNGLALAAICEIAIGVTFGLAVAIPQGALHMSGWLSDIQTGTGAAQLFNPGAQGDVDSLIGTALMLATTVLFFTLDLHLTLYRALVASIDVLPVGALAFRFDPEAFFGMVGASFLFGLMVMAPVMLGLFAVDVGVAYATRSMPQANVYFLMLPLKILVSLLLLMATLPFMPALLGRLFRDAFSRLPAMVGA